MIEKKKSKWELTAIAHEICADKISMLIDVGWPIDHGDIDYFNIPQNQMEDLVKNIKKVAFSLGERAELFRRNSND